MKPYSESADPTITECANCGALVCMVEGCHAHPEGSELADGSWVCSYECWEALVRSLDKEEKK